MNLGIYTGDNSLSEFLRKTLRCIPNETFFEKEFCFFSAFDSVNALKQTDIQVVVFARKRINIVFITYSYSIFPLFVTLFVHSCTSFHMKVGSFRIFSTTYSAVSKVFLMKKKS